LLFYNGILFKEKKESEQLLEDPESATWSISLIYAPKFRMMFYYIFYINSEMVRYRIFLTENRASITLVHFSPVLPHCNIKHLLWSFKLAMLNKLSKISPLIVNKKVMQLFS
jgi:hypothetical protein